MPIDGYSLCPCGTGKKVKFCCPDLLGELQKIERMLEGEQYRACLGHIERLQQQYPDRACLLALKATLLRALGQWEQVRANAAAFVEKHPHNPTALAESAMAATAIEGGRAAQEILQRALAACRGIVPARVYEAMGAVAQVLLSEGRFLAGRALLQLQTALHREDEYPVDVLVELNGSADVPLLLKDDPRITPCPDDAPWKGRFADALASLGLGGWREAADKLTALARDVPDSPAIWRNLATLRGWLADDGGCSEALRRLAATAIPLEDAVEAEALAMLLTDTPLGDPVEVLAATWTIHDVESLQAALTLDSRAVEVSLDPSSLGDGDHPRPRAAYLVVDRATPQQVEDLTPEIAARLLGRALLYGRQTDREARLEVLGVTRDDLPRVQSLLRQIAGDAMDVDSVKEGVIGRTSASRQLLAHNWRLPASLTRTQIDELVVAHTRDALLNRWPHLKLGIFDGKSASEVAGDESCRVRLLAAVLVLQTWSEASLMEFDFNQLRSQLGLPPLEPIDTGQVEVEELPLVRLSRVVTESASDEALCEGYELAVAFAAAAAVRKFAHALVERPSLAGRPEQLRAYRTLATMERDSNKALEYVEQGRRATESAGLSSASWDLLEMTIRLARREGREVGRLVEHIQDRHIEEPGVAEALTQFLVGMGALRPDGTPAPLPTEAEAPVSAGGGAGAPARKLWTPDSQGPGGGQRIWTPD
jgi:tetratricopeptide (TPR) repeat protein